MCTSFRITAADGSTVVGRTMEFPTLMGAEVVVAPRGLAGGSVGPDGAGKRWTNRYGYVGVDGFGDPQALTDGVNEAGLYANLQYMPGFCDYESPDGVPADRLVTPPNLVSFVLATCSSVAEVRAAMADTVVWPQVYGPFGFAPPSHLVVHDRTGASVVVEWVGGRQVLFDNPIGVATNWPHFDWHLVNLRNYLKLDTKNPQPVIVGGVELAPMGEGVGMTGLPGDTTSPARFVRAVAYTATLRPVPSGPAAEVAALHILNNFDIPFGMDRADDDPAHDDHTLWSSIANLTAPAYTVRTYDDPVPRRLDLAEMDFDAPAVSRVPLPATADFPPLRVEAGGPAAGQLPTSREAADHAAGAVASRTG